MSLSAYVFRSRIACGVSMALSACVISGVLQPARAVDTPYHSLHDFLAYPKGNRPSGGLIKANNGYFYGVTIEGGQFGQGTIFKMSVSGNITVVYNFSGHDDGGSPNGPLAQGPDGTLYGTTRGGGRSLAGVVFKFSPATGAFKVISPQGSLSYPAGGLVFGSDGALYGYEAYGGPNFGAAVFRCTTAGSVTLIHTFASEEGHYFDRALCAGSDGLLYGSTIGGGKNGLGVIFATTVTGTFTTVRDLTATDGFSPSTLVEGADGKLYGGTSGGGANQRGTIFRISKNGSNFEVLHAMTTADGSLIQGPLLLASDGKYYGCARISGNGAGNGTVFSISTNGDFSLLRSFTLADGDSPVGGLIEGASGTFYGETDKYSNYTLGAAFKITTAGVFTQIDRFPVVDGAFPTSTPVLARDGNYYGVTFGGGVNNNGSLYRVSPDGTETVLQSFGPGVYPSPEGLTLGPDGNLYGAWTNNAVRIKLDGTIIKLLGFTTSRMKLNLGADGCFYAANYYDFYRMSPSGVFTKLAPVPAGVTIRQVIRTADGSLIAVASANTGYGSLLRVSPEGTVTTVHEFTNGADGGHPDIYLSLSPDGSVYGVTRSWQSNYGTIFRVTPSGAFSTYYTFPFSGQWRVIGGITVGKNGTIYGVAENPSSQAIVYAVTPAGAFTRYGLLPFFDSNTELNFGVDGLLCGYRSSAGEHGNGVIFNFLPPPSQWHAASMATGSDNATRVLWASKTGASSLWDVDDATGTYTHIDIANQSATPSFVAVGPDSHSRIAWVGAGNAITLRDLNESTGAYTQKTFGPFTNWTPRAISVGADNLTRIAWALPNGVSLWYVKDSNWTFTQRSFKGPVGATFVGVATGSDNHSRIAWKNADGGLTLLDVNDSTGASTQNTFAPITGRTPQAISVGADGLTRVAWTGANGALLLWDVNDANWTFTQRAYTGPLNYTVSGLSTGPDNKTRVAWTNADGKLALWDVTESTGAHTQFVYGPL